MRLEVLSKEDMISLSKELSKEGIMNKTQEKLGWELNHFMVIRGKFGELIKRSKGITPVIDDTLDEIQVAFNALMSNWEVGEEREFEDLFDEVDIAKVTLIAALIEGGYAAGEEKLKLLAKPRLEELEIELKFNIDDLEDVLKEVEGKLDATLTTELSFARKYFVEILEIEEELIKKALEIAEGYATEESLIEAMFVGIGKAVLAQMILSLAEEKNTKIDLIEVLLEHEPIDIEGKREKISIYFDEGALEDFLKELQRMGYLKVKGNRIWV